MEEINNNIAPKNEKEIVPIENEQGQGEEASIISDEMLLGVYGEILDNIRQDRVQVDSFLNDFAEMVINGGDSTSASKEAVVNLLKAKMDAADKMAKVADLMTRLKLKDNGFKPYLNKGTNTINIIENSAGRSKASVLSDLKKKKQAAKEQKQ